eukprot:1103792_1
MAGKTTYFKSQINRWTTLWTSYNHPPETPNMTYIYEDYSHNTSCWSFGTTSDTWNIINEDYDEITTVATCSVCNVTSVPYPEHCPLWNIIGYGLDPDFTISTGDVCQADDWSHSIDRPLSVCSWNISSNEYYFMNDETWHLYTTDTHNNTYYYNSDDVQYIYQYHHPPNQWVWAVSHFVGDTNYNIFCPMQHPNQDIFECETWYFYDTQTSEFTSNHHMILQSSECPTISEMVCVYDSSKTQLNGEYEVKPYAHDYDGWKKDLMYLIYRDWSWYIASVDGSIIYASCKSSSPYNPMECNNKWHIHDKSFDHIITDPLKIWNSTCDTVPTSLPTVQPTLHPSMEPTTSPTNHPTSLKPTVSPSLTPTIISSSRSTTYITDEELTTKTPITSTEVGGTKPTQSMNRDRTSVHSMRSTNIFKDYSDDSPLKTVLSTDTFVVMLGIDKTSDSYVYEQPRFRETIDEYMTQHLQDKVDQYLRKSADSMGITHKTPMTPPSHFNNEGKPIYDPNRLYAEHMHPENTQYPTAAPWNEDAMTQSFASGDSQQQYVERRMTNEARCEYSSESMDINNGVPSHRTSYESESEDDTEKKNSKTHLYHIVIDEDDVLNEDEFNRQIDARHEQGMLSRRSIGDQSVLSRITDASFGSNQTEEKEDHAFYNKMSRLQVSKEALAKQPIEAAVFPDYDDVEGAETIQTVVIKPTDDRARESVQLTVSSPVMARKSLNMTKRGFMDEECEKAVGKKEDIENDEAILNIISPRRHGPPPNTEIHSPSSGDDEETMDIDMDTILDLKHTQHAMDKHRKSMELQVVTPKGHHIQSMSRRSGRSFVTLFDEKKDIEADHLQIDSDDTCIDLDDDQLDLDESMTEDLSKQLFGAHSVVNTLTDIPEITSAPPLAAFQQTLQSHDIIHNKYYNHSHNHIAFKMIHSNSVNVNNDDDDD